MRFKRLFPMLLTAHTFAECESTLGRFFRLFTSNFNDSTPTHDYGISYLFFNFDEVKNFTSHSLENFFTRKSNQNVMHFKRYKRIEMRALIALSNPSVVEFIRWTTLTREYTQFKNTCSKKKWTNISFEMRRGYLWIRLKILTKLCAMFAISITWRVSYHFRKLECTKLFENAILRVSAWKNTFKKLLDFMMDIMSVDGS